MILDGSGTFGHMNPADVLGVSVMNEAWMLTFALTLPFLCLGLLMWLDRLEDTLGDGIDGSQAGPEPAPVAEPAPALSVVPAEGVNAA